MAEQVSSDAERSRMPRRTAEQRRMCLVAVARTLFASQGFHSTGMAQIAHESKVAVGQIYRDFASKEDLMAAIVEQDLATMLDDSVLRDAVAAGDQRALRAWVRTFVEGDEADCDPLYAEILAEAQRNEKVRAILRSGWERVRALLDLALEALVPGDHRRVDRTRAAEVIMTLSGGMLHRRLLPSPCAGCGLAERLVDLVERELDELTIAPGGGRAGA